MLVIEFIVIYTNVHYFFNLVTVSIADLPKDKEIEGKKHSNANGEKY